MVCWNKNKGGGGVHIQLVVLYSAQKRPLRLIPVNFVSLLRDALLLMPTPCCPWGGDRAKDPDVLRNMLRLLEACPPREALERGREAVERGRDAGEVLFCFFFNSTQGQKKIPSHNNPWVDVELQQIIL
jgi:hypothetical protein